MPKTILIAILLIVAVGGGYIIFGSNLFKDSTTVILESAAKEIGVAYPDIKDGELDWNFQKGDSVRTISVAGKGFEAVEISADSSEKLDSYFANLGFVLDVYNVSAGTMSWVDGYKKEQTVCVVVNGFSGYKKAGDQWIPSDPSKLDIDIHCGIAAEEINGEISKEEAIRYAFSEKYGRKLSTVKIDVEKESDSYVRGSVSFFGDNGEGGIFLAAKVNGIWKIAFDGNGAISCEEMMKYNFPGDMIEDCAYTQRVETEVDEEFAIVLSSNPTTGYSWQTVFSEEFVELVSQSYTPSSELLGAGGVEIFMFNALQEGETEIRFSYVRPWESRQPVDEKVYTVVIEK